MRLPDLLDRDVLAGLVAPLEVEVRSDPEPIGDEYGYGSARAAAVVSIGASEPRPAVIKVWDAEKHGLGEVEFYDEWAPRLPVRLAECLAAGASDPLGMLVLEDLRPMRQGDELAPLDGPEACELARYMAQVHRATVGEVSDLDPPRFGTTLPSEWHDARRVAWVERFGLPEHPVLRAIVIHSVVADQLAAALGSDAPAGLAHSDLHLDNVIFKDTGPIVIDWARPGWGSATHDLSSVLFSCAATEDFDRVIAAHREFAPSDDDAVDGEVLKRLLTATLGVASWIPATPRQERLIANGLQRAIEVAEWLGRRRPGLQALLRG